MMSKKPKAPPLRPPEPPKPPVVMRIRRCHVCGHINEVPLSEALRRASESEASQRCESCGKHLAPFLFFDESVFDGVNADAYFLSQLTADAAEGVYRPLWGFLAFWPEEGSAFESDATKLASQPGGRSGGKN